ELEDYFILTKQYHGSNDIPLQRIFYRFTITTPDGCKYIFGGTDQSIEFTRSAAEGDADMPDRYHSRVVPTSWYLTKIISRDGHEINFTSERDGIQAPLSSNFVEQEWQYIGGPLYTSVADFDTKAVIINPSYLSKITAPNQIVKFSRHASNQKEFDYET